MADFNPTGKLDFKALINQYTQLQSKVVSMVQSLNQLTHASPGKFLLIQFYLSQVTQIGDAISNMVSQINSMINNSVRNYKSS